MKKFIVYFNHESIERPVIKVVDNEKNQVILAFVSDGQHTTLHLENDGSILRTHWGADKPRGTWDDETVAIAKKLGYKNPEKHGKYYAHSPIGHINDTSEKHLIGKRINIPALPGDKEGYRNLGKRVVSAPYKNGMANFYFSPNREDNLEATSFPVSLGRVTIRFEE